MKTLAVLLFTLLLSHCYTNREFDPSSCVAVSVWWDKTDTIAGPTIESIHNLFGLKADHSQGAWFRTGMIKDVEFTLSDEFYVEPQSFLTSNIAERNKEIDQFYDNTKNCLIKQEESPTGRGHSSIYNVVAREANLLSKQKGIKHLILFSNLFEHTSTFSVLNHKDYYRLVNHPDEVIQEFSNRIPLSDLHGVKLIVIYQPTYIHEEKFKRMVKVYREIFSSAGAEVQIQANL